jgi:hypothetical protein
MSRQTASSRLAPCFLPCRERDKTPDDLSVSGHAWVRWGFPCSRTGSCAVGTLGLDGRRSTLLGRILSFTYPFGVVDADAWADIGLSVDCRTMRPSDGGLHRVRSGEPGEDKERDKILGGPGGFYNGHAV